MMFIQRQFELFSRREKIDSYSLNLQTDEVVWSELLELCREFKWEVSEKNGCWTCTKLYEFVLTSHLLRG